MMREITILLTVFSFQFLFIGCSDVAEKEMLNANTKMDSISPNLNPEKVCIPSQLNGFLGSISVSSVGIVNLGTALPNLEEYIEYEIQSVQQILPQTEGKEKYQTIHHLYYNMTEVMLLEMSSEDESSIRAITTFSPNYYLDNCIHVSSTFEDLKIKYSNLSIMLNFDDNMLYVVSPSLIGVSFILMPTAIKDVSLIDQSTGEIAVENINPNEVVINIRIEN